MKFILLLAVAICATNALPSLNAIVPEETMVEVEDHPFIPKHVMKAHALLQLKNKGQATAFPWTVKCKAGVSGDGVAPNVFVDVTNGKDYQYYNKKKGLLRGTREKPYQSLQYAVSRVIDENEHKVAATGDCVTINLMAGTYHNSDFGKEGGGDEFVLDLDNVKDMIIKNDDATTGASEAAKVVVEFDGPGGFVGGTWNSKDESKRVPVTDLEVYGFEIKGPNEKITFQAAMNDRLVGTNYYKGQGISVWHGYRIWLHDMKVHHTPGAGLRVNNGDYLVVEDSEVYATTWWSKSGESAIVFAQAHNMDDEDKIKILMRNNKVYNNMNRMPYYNPNYAWNYFPIGKQYCTPDEAQTACKALYQCCGPSDQSCCADTTKKYACPWQCRYGKASQDYVIDGQGVYVTRNSDTYLKGIMELSGNIAYENGINGLVFHRTHNGEVKKNTIWNNGQLPRDDYPEDLKCDKPEDADCWKIPLSKKDNPDKPKTQRQPYSGLTLSNSNNVKLYSNLVKARYSDDKSYEFEIDSGNDYTIAAGSNNKNCQGKISSKFDSYVKTLKEGGTEYNKKCTDEVLNKNK
jgi:parallel beta-helix repeat protein